MGLAASQARYLSLTARENNLEYMGQQINQERTILAQQCSALYNSLLTLDVPTPPSTTEYTKVQYTASSGTTKYVFDASNVKPMGNGKYVIKMSYTAPGNIFEQNTGYKAVVKKDDSNDYEIDGKVAHDFATRPTDMTEEEYNDYKKAIADSGILDKDKKALTEKDFYYYIDDEGEKHFAIKTDVEAAAGKTEAPGAVRTYDIVTGKVNKTIEQKDCTLTFDPTNGRIEKVEIPTEDGKRYIQYDLVASTITDEQAYKDAEKKYNYDQYLYDKQMQDINAKTETIQKEDKNLELKLQRLDTERSAIEKELEAVKKVMNDDIDKSFNAFNA